MFYKGSPHPLRFTKCLNIFQNPSTHSVQSNIPPILYRLASLAPTWNRLVGQDRPFTECNEIIISLTIPVSLLSHTVENISTQDLNTPHRSIHHTSPKKSIDFPIFQKIKKFIKLKLAFFTWIFVYVSGDGWFCLIPAQLTGSFFISMREKN